MAKVDYTPVGLVGYDCILTTENGSLVRASVADATSEVGAASADITGDIPLRENAALVATLAGYARSEWSFRRARREDKKKILRRQADDFLRGARLISEYVDRPQGSSRSGWCSSCFELSTHVRVLKTGQPVSVYLCRSCGSPTTPCVAARCTHLARRGTRSLSTPRYCAEHRHEIPNFDTARGRLEELSDVTDWLTFSKTNLARVTKVTAISLAAGFVVAPAAFVAAPVVGGALGAAGGLSGAAATSHGLAVLGGGSLAAGGFGMAGGTVVVTAAGTALGGTLGATTATAYTKSDKSFQIEKLRGGHGTPVVLATGFLTEGQNGWGPWRRMIDAAYPENPVYRVHWGAKELAAFAMMFGLAGSKRIGQEALKRTALRAMKAAGTKLGPLGGFLLAADVAANPWTVARTRADMTGAALADILARTDGAPFILVGHSLGGRVMAESALALATKSGVPILQDMHLLGTAMGQKRPWHTATTAVHGAIYNYHSRNDMVLKLLFQVAELGSRPVGLAGIGIKDKKIKDRNVGRKVVAHSDYFANVDLVTPGPSE